MSNAKILVVDDQQELRTIFKVILEHQGYCVEEAVDGEDALDVLAHDLELPDLILLDLMMPNLDGIGFRTSQLEVPRIAEIPVVILSADSRAPQVAAKLGDLELLRKPFDLNQLIETVHRYTHAVR